MKNVHGEGNSVQSFAIANNSSTTGNYMYTNDGMQGQSEESYTDEETGEETEEVSSENSDESEEEDNNPWKLILNKVFQTINLIRDTSIDKTMQEDEITHEEARKHVYDALTGASELRGTGGGGLAPHFFS